MNMPTYTHTCLRETCAHTHVHAHTCTEHIYAHIRTHTYTCARVHADGHTYTHTLGWLKKYQKSQYATGGMDNIWKTDAACGEGVRQGRLPESAGLGERVRSQPGRVDMAGREAPSPASHP